MAKLRDLSILAILVSIAGLIALTVVTLFDLPRIDKPPQPLEVQGKLAWQAHYCMGCHTLLGNGGYYAPELTGAYEKRGRAWLQRWLTDPSSVDTMALMPNIHLQPSEVGALIAFLDRTGRTATNGWPPKPLAQAAPRRQDAVDRGKQLFTTQGCDGCHSIGGQGGSFGPDLSTIGSERDKAWLERFLQGPGAVVSNNGMPTPDLTPSQRADLVAYLLSNKRPSR